MYKVTKQHIKDGNLECVSSCPIALCLRDSFKCKVYVDNKHIVIENQDINRYKVTPELNTWIEDYDWGETVNPIELVIKENKVYIKDDVNV